MTLHHFTHPAWLGDDFWLSSDSPAVYADWVTLVVDRLGNKCRHWITVNEFNILSFANYVLGIYPPGRRMALGDFHSATAHLLAAHVKGYEQVHAKDPVAFVTTNNSATSIYEYDRMFVDLLLAPASGIGREDLEDWLIDRRAAWYAALDPPSPMERLLRRASAAASPIARTNFRFWAQRVRPCRPRPIRHSILPSTPFTKARTPSHSTLWRSISTTRLLPTT